MAEGYISIPQNHVGFSRVFVNEKPPEVSKKLLAKSLIFYTLAYFFPLVKTIFLL